MISRRLFLRRAAVAAPLVAVPSLAVAANHVDENPALLGLEPALAAAEAEMIAANAAHDEALKIGRELWPRAPEAITYERSSYDSNMERDITGQGAKGAPGLHQSEVFRDHIQATRRWRKMTPEREELRRSFHERLRLAEEYEAACENARVMSGYPAAFERRTVAISVLKGCVQAVHDQPAATMAGVCIKAKALRAWGLVPHFDRYFQAIEGDNWGLGLAESTLEVAG